MRTWHASVRPALEEFAPELILISAGFDADARDPLTGLCVTAHGFEQLTQEIVQLAQSYCEGRIVSVLEGGYSLAALKEDVPVHLGALSM